MALRICDVDTASVLTEATRTSYLVLGVRPSIVALMLVRSTTLLDHIRMGNRHSTLNSSTKVCKLGLFHCSVMVVGVVEDTFTPSGGGGGPTRIYIHLHAY